VLRSILRELRERSGVSQRELCKKLGRSYTYVHKIESGDREVGVVEAVEFISAIGADPREFFARFLEEFGL
jgi:transcriptional regulator with XRE-family HTH domain